MILNMQLLLFALGCYGKIHPQSVAMETRFNQYANYSTRKITTMSWSIFIKIYLISKWPIEIRFINIQIGWLLGKMVSMVINECQKKFSKYTSGRLSKGLSVDTKHVFTQLTKIVHRGC